MVEATREFPSELRQLSQVRAFIEDACRDCFVSPAAEHALFQLELAVQEAVTNVIRHAHRGLPDRLFRVEIAADAQQVAVLIRYDGEDFDPSSVPPPCFDGSKSGGFGVFIINKSVDEVSYKREQDGRCTIRLVKQVPCGGAETA